MARNLITNRDLSDAERKDLRLQGAILQKAFAGASVLLDTQLKIGIERASILVEGTAAQLAPVDKGLLRKSLSHRIIMREGYPIGQVGTNVEYAAYVEFGTGEFAEDGSGRKGGWSYKDENGNWVWTRGNKPQSFLRRALNQHKTGIKTVITRALKEVL